MLEKLNIQLKLEKIIQFLTYLFLFVLPWQTIWIYRESFLNGMKWEYGTLGFYGTEILLWVIVVLFIVWFWKERKLRNLEIKKFSLTKDRIFLFTCLLFIVYNLLSIVWSSDKSLALQQSLRVMEAILLFLIIFIGPFEKENLLKWFIYGTIFPAILGIWQFLSQTTFASTLLGLADHPSWQAGTSIVQSETIGRWLRAYGPFSHPNIFGGYLVVVIVTLLHCHIVNLRNEGRGMRNILFFIVYFLSFVALFFTFSRSAWLAIAVGLFITYHISHITYQKVKVIWYVFGVTCFVILSVIYFPLVQTRFSGQSISEVRSATERISGYDEAWQLFKKQPILGVGAGNYTLSAYLADPARVGWEYQPVHNTLVLFIAEGGIVGIILLVFVSVSFIIYFLSKNQESDKTKNLPDFVFLFFCFLVLMSFDHYLYSSFVGLALSAVFWGLILKSNPQELPS